MPCCLRTLKYLISCSFCKIYLCLFLKGIKWQLLLQICRLQKIICKWFITVNFKQRILLGGTASSICEFWLRQNPYTLLGLLSCSCCWDRHSLFQPHLMDANEWFKIFWLGVLYNQYWFNSRWLFGCHNCSSKKNLID